MTGRPVSPARVDAPSGVRSAYALLLERSDPSRTIVTRRIRAAGGRTDPVLARSPTCLTLMPLRKEPFHALAS